MNSSWFGLLELLLVFGAVFGFGWAQLRAVEKRLKELETESQQDDRVDPEDNP